MGDTSKIEWTDSTFNPWIGCTNVSPGCDHCYAEDLNKFRKWTEWGPHGERRRTSASTWDNPRQWQRAAQIFERANKRRRRVFCASLSDVFDNQAPPEWRQDLWTLIRETPALDWQLLTKRPQNILKQLPADWGDGWPHVWLGVSAEDQKHYDLRWTILSQIPAAIRFISYEPALGPLSIAASPYPHWIISGGESGPKARDMEPAWARSLRDQCSILNIPLFHKQWGTYRSNPLVVEQRIKFYEAQHRDPHGKGGGLIDGKLHRAFPT